MEKQNRVPVDARLSSCLLPSNVGTPLAPSDSPMPSAGTAIRENGSGITMWSRDLDTRPAEKEALVSKRFSPSLLVVALLVFAFAVPSFAAPVPSKTAANQSLDQRTADLALVRDIAANDQVATVLTKHGFTQEQVNQRLSRLSPQDLHQLANNLDQIQAAGMTHQEWIWIGIGALAALILVVALG